ncbi:putative 2-iminobutanoate/2-iminopropanoate deaminase [Hyphomicrobiales bacterium]|nr:putative 2-iminobutanoate/2-iminopropanoate deaminase [Hyphomicrobiales bacterium]CAH1688998.1 putative 2-iminobutanoate/2-iminopropanoate deaminase [Hyphomicrobiales bacterium]
MSQTDERPLTIVNPPGLYDPSPYGYSHLALVAPGSRLVYVAGQGGETLDGSMASDFRAQVRQSLANLRTALQGAGASFSDVAKLTVLIVDHSEERLGIFGAEMAAVWNDGLKPTCTLIPVPRLALDAMLVEIDAVAVLPA